MYRFKTGKFAGKSMEQVMLRNAPDLYEIAGWATDKPQLDSLLREFNHLRRALQEAPIVVSCAKSGCKRHPETMTLPIGPDRYYWPAPYFWCRKHEPWEKDGISPKLPIHFDTLDSFRDKKNRSAVHKSVLAAYGIKKASITERFASRFFANLS